MSGALPSSWLGVPAAPRRLAPGDLLFRQGERTFGVFQLAAGSIRLQRFTPGGTAVTMHTVREGEMFAEAALFSDRYHCEAEALRTSDVLVFSRANVLQALQSQPPALMQLAQDLAHRVQDLRQRIEMRQPRSAAERVLQYLRLHADPRGSWDPPGSLKDWAEEIGLTHEALYRTLARLERDGTLRRRGATLSLQPEGEAP